MSSYNITVNNEAGRPSNYIITSEKPEIKGSPCERWPLVIASGRAHPGSDVQFSIDVPNPYYGYSIQSQGKACHGSGVTVTNKAQVQLGTDQQRGTTLKYEIEHGQPVISNAGASNGQKGAFSIQTGDFSAGDARNNGYLIGYGSRSAAWGTFVPEPRVTYQLFPKKVFYLTAADHRADTMVDTQTFSDPLSIDFDNLGRLNVSVTHGPDGRLVIS